MKIDITNAFVADEKFIKNLANELNKSIREFNEIITIEKSPKCYCGHHKHSHDYYKGACAYSHRHDFGAEHSPPIYDGPCSCKKFNPERYIRYTRCGKEI